ncbi:peptide alpha-N-acetyltransferase complex A subunit NAT1 [Aspergillus clavatus NRRL 1]|uniref:N-terminal acetyltransferase catalytic subunit (NAT1), putative n=1 Tax=Aspergillus clavatus (strain ATCC 1007 / CBS 513.65 / DSM 816 / NCTC 3887 / NRRL 1 / QM 1276 / 107) TaxID=344612 RepID=A1CIB8_ASPCL|nr:N-terminal acetyltransferase catalytic subunit (NAT1), putative [Aspergillus clavatus NRRL 1]EAW10623.1 N-terminal acetyltransferase catalytic subunit (NAT1), putative [Aspergillus clavatus NRRL 1]
MPQPLSSKDASSFRQVVRHYETKQYKKGIKLADQILRKTPNHGETQAMKALIMSNIGQQEEAFTLAKEALRNDMKSHVCWHVYGLLYRAEKNYEEAIKAYRFALRIEPESPQIQRDLALLQMQMRDYQGYVQSRSAMLQARPGFRQNWTALAIAHHLAGDLEEAEKVLTTYEETLKQQPPVSDMEHSEAVLYKNMIMAEAGKVEQALEHLESIGYRMTDVLAVMEMKADYLLRLGRKVEAEAAYTALLDRNPENSIYFDGLIRAKGISGGDHKALKAVYDTWADKHPRGDASRRIPLDFLEGEEFKQAADAYLQRMLKKGVPSLFANIKSLYTNPEKRDTVQELVEGYVSGGDSTQSNGTTDEQANGDKKTDFMASAHYFLAQHYNYHLSRDLAKAMENVEKAIELAPKAVEYQMTKARIWKHYGNPQKAAEEMEKARLLDEKDRYINSKAAKYHLRNHDNEKALDNMSKFTRNEAVGGALGDLHEMQCIWYLTEDGESYLRQKKLGLALKRFNGVYNIFDVWQEDQFDFHSFSLRKGMIRAYVDMVRWENRLREHPFYTRMAIAAIKAYILLHDQPDLAHGPLPSGLDASGDADSAERKKALKKAKKEQQRLEKIEADKREARKAAAATAKGADTETKKEDPDPLGTKLVQTQDPLADALKFLTSLLEYSPQNIEVQCLGFEVYLRKNKLALALKCLSAAHAIDASNSTVHVQQLRFRKALDSLSEPLSPEVAEVVNAEFDKLLPKSQDLGKWNESFLSTHKDSAPHTQAGLICRQLLQPESKAQCEKDLTSTLDLSDISIETALAGLEMLHEWGSDQAAKTAYAEKASNKWPESSVFQLS